MRDAEHPLRRMLDAAARGCYPAPDGKVDVLPALSGPADVIVAFTGHFALAAEVSPDAVAARVPPGDFSTPMSSAFLSWVADKIGSRPGTYDVVLCAPARGGGRPGWLSVETDAAHPRIERARRYRYDVGAWSTGDRDAVVVVGKGVCGRWEGAFEVAPGARNRGLGRRVAEAARDLVPSGETLWLQIAPCNAASLRAALAAGFVPVGAEVLFPRAG
jgi:RimJ/RimL family protein N-acetyltransferase